MPMLDDLLGSPSAQFALGLLANNVAPRLSGTRAARASAMQGGLAGAAQAQKLGLLQQEADYRKAMAGASLMKAMQPDIPEMMQQYEFARQQGFQGSYMDFLQQKGGGETDTADLRNAKAMFPNLPMEQALTQYYQATKPKFGARVSPEGGIEIGYGVGDSPIPAGQQGSMMGEAQRNLETDALLKQVEENFDPSFLTYQGQWRNWMQNQAAKLGADSPAFRETLGKQRKWEEGLRQIFNEYRRYVTGAAASVLEMKDIEASITNPNLSPPQYAASFQALRDRVSRAKAGHKAALQMKLAPGTDAYGEFIDRYMQEQAESSVPPPPPGFTEPVR